MFVPYNWFIVYIGVRLYWIYNLLMKFTLSCYWYWSYFCVYVVLVADVLLGGISADGVAINAVVCVYFSICL